MTALRITYRPIRSNEVEILSELLYQAIYVAPGSQPITKGILKDPSISKYIDNWGSLMYDIVIVACDQKEIVGGIWGRIFPKDNPGYGFINEQIPEISLSVLPKYRNMGIGTEMIQRIQDAYRELQIQAISLSVDKGNPARRLLRADGVYVLFREWHGHYNVQAT